MIKMIFILRFAALHKKLEPVLGRKLQIWHIEAAALGGTVLLMLALLPGPEESKEKRSQSGSQVVHATTSSCLQLATARRSRSRQKDGSTAVAFQAKGTWTRSCQPGALPRLAHPCDAAFCGSQDATEHSKGQAHSRSPYPLMQPKHSVQARSRTAFHVGSPPCQVCVLGGGVVGCAVARALAPSVDTLLLVGKPSFQFFSRHFTSSFNGF